MTRPRVRPRPLLVGLLLLAVVAALGFYTLFRPRLSYPNVVVIVVDTLRADRLSTYGNPRPTSPAIDRLAAEGMLFENAYVPCSWTLPSVASLQTGLLPPAHGVIHWSDGLSAEMPTLAEVMKRNGYVTVGLMANPNVTADAGFGRGFDHFLETRTDSSFEQPGSVPGYPSARTVTDRAIRYLDDLAEDRFFLYVHYMDTHAPYLLPPEAEDPFGDPGYDGRMVSRFDDVRTLMGPRFMHLHAYFWSKFEQGPRDRERVRSLYDAKVLYTTDQVGRLVDHLDQLGVAESTLVVFTSDHGEGLADHDIRAHGDVPYEHQIRVPLVMRGPGIDRSRVDEGPVELADLPLAVTGLAVDPDLRWVHAPAAGSGRLLAQLGLGNLPDAVGSGEGGSAVSDVYLRDDAREYRSVRLGDYKLILDVREDRVRLFDLADDPGELQDRVGADPDLEQRLRRIIENRLGPASSVPHDGADPSLLDPETLERLRAMGYVG